MPKRRRMAPKRAHDLAAGPKPGEHYRSIRDFHWRCRPQLMNED